MNTYGVSAKSYVPVYEDLPNQNHLESGPIRNTQPAVFFQHSLS